MTNYEWDDNEWPLAFLITIRTFGTWLHGDDPYSVDRHGKNVFGLPKIEPNENLSRLMAKNRIAREFVLDTHQRGVVEAAVRDMCKFRGYGLYAINVRTNHAHCVIASSKKPESIINAIKSNSTRELRSAGLVDEHQAIWSRGGSRRYLWKPSHVDGAIDYVLYGQGDDLPSFLK